MNKTELLELLKLDIIDTNNEEDISKLLKLNKDEIALVKKDRGCAKYYFQILMVLKERPDLELIRPFLTTPWKYLLKDIAKVYTPEHLKSDYILDISKMIMESYEYNCISEFLKMLNNDEKYYTDIKTHYILKHVIDNSDNKPLLEQFIKIVNNDKLKSSEYYDFIIEKSLIIKRGSSMENFINIVTNEEILKNPSFKEIINKYIDSHDLDGYLSRLITNEDVIESNKIIKLLDYYNNIDDISNKNCFCKCIAYMPELLSSDKFDVVLNIGKHITKIPNSLFNYYMMIASNETIYNTKSYIKILTLLGYVTDEDLFITFYNVICSNNFSNSKYFAELIEQINTVNDMEYLCKRRDLICDEDLLNSQDGKLEYALHMSRECNDLYLPKFIKMAISRSLVKSPCYNEALEIILDIYKKYASESTNKDDFENLQSLIYIEAIIDSPYYLDYLNLIRNNSIDNIDLFINIFSNKEIIKKDVYLDIMKKVFIISDRMDLEFYRWLIQNKDLLLCDSYSDFVTIINKLDFSVPENKEIFDAFEAIITHYYGDMFNEIIESIVKNPTKDYILALSSVISYSDNALELIINDSNYNELIEQIKYLDDLAENNYTYQFIRDYIEGHNEYTLNKSFISIASNPVLVQLDTYQNIIDNVAKIDDDKIDMIRNLINKISNSEKVSSINDFIDIMVCVQHSENFVTLYKLFMQDDIINYPHFDELLNLLKENINNDKFEVIIKCLFDSRVLKSKYYIELFNIVKKVLDKGILNTDILNSLVHVIKDYDADANDINSLLSVYLECFNEINKNILPILAISDSLESYIDERIKETLVKDEKLIDVIKINELDKLEEYLESIPDDAEIDENTILKVRKK